MSEIDFVAAHAADVVPGRGATRAGQAMLGVFKRTGGEVAEAAAKKATPQLASTATKKADVSPSAAAKQGGGDEGDRLLSQHA